MPTLALVVLLALGGAAAAMARQSAAQIVHAPYEVGGPLVVRGLLTVHGPLTVAGAIEVKFG